MNGEHAGAEHDRKVVAEGGHRRSEKGKNEHPQQKRALVISPHPGNAIEQGFRLMRVLEDVGDGEIRDDIEMDERAEGERDQQELHERRGASHPEQCSVAARCTEQGQSALNERHRKGEDEGEMAELGDHRAGAPLIAAFDPGSFHWPLRLMASATSRGM